MNQRRFRDRFRHSFADQQREATCCSCANVRTWQRRSIQVLRRFSFAFFENVHADIDFVKSN